MGKNVICIEQTTLFNLLIIIYHPIIADDFSLLNNIGRSFPPGSSVNDSMCFEVEPVDDSIIEQTESFEFEVQLRNLLDTATSEPQLELIIVDDDGKWRYLDIK